MMQTTPEQLEKQGYTLQHKLAHEDMMPFINQYIKKPTLYGWGYYAICALMFFLVVFLFSQYYFNHQITLTTAFNTFFTSMLWAFLLIPLHEFIHVMAYKSQGAVNTSYDVVWKKLIFLAVADRFVASKKEFTVVALAPFITITLLLLLPLPFLSPYWKMVLLCINGWHVTFCIGDFALLSYFACNGNNEVVTYDDKANRVSYFYVRTPVSHTHQ